MSMITEHKLSCMQSDTQWVPKRDARKQEMTAEGRGRSCERTDANGPLSKKTKGKTIQYSRGKRQHS